MFWKFPLKVQAYTSQTDSWYTKEFATKKDFTAYIQDQFKEEPQFYKLKNTKKWKEVGQHYADTVCRPNFEGGRYHNFSDGSAKFNHWYDTERDKIKNGVIYDDLYIPPFYHWYLNFCPIYNDFTKLKQFADVWDGDLWYFHYCMLCILKGKHIGGVKGRQKGYSFKHMAILYWAYCWFENSVVTVGAYDEKLVKKSWRFLGFYREHINSNTEWIRGPQIPKALEWNEVQYDENSKPHGLGSILKGVTFKQSPFNDVGGSQTFFNYEEPGVSPTLLETIEAQRPALEKGSVTTGYIIACGSVGELEDAEGIKEIFYKPRDYNFLPVKNVWDKKSGIKECCIFISEAYNMIGEDVSLNEEEDPYLSEYTGRPFIDADGNSDVELAKAWIERQSRIRKDSKKKSSLKQIAESQKCTSPEQAFAQRSKSEWPTELMSTHQQRLDMATERDSLTFKPLKGLLYEDKDGLVTLKTTEIPEEHGYPINAEWEDKRGVVTIYEQPVSTKPEFKLYFGGLDPVEAEVTTTSQSVLSLYIYKAPHSVEYRDAKGNLQTRIEGDKIVASYVGRFDSIEKTNEQAWLLIKMYNAFTIVERNKPNFISYMQRNGRAEMYLAKEKDFPMFKDLPIDVQLREGGKFGFHKGKLKTTEEKDNSAWKYMKDIAKEYFSMEYGTESFTNSAGIEEVVKIYRGIDRIPDRWLLEEFIQDNGKVNVDRIISFLAALFLCKITFQSIPMKRVNEVKEDKPKIKKPLPQRAGFIPQTKTTQSRRYSQKSFLKTS